MNFTVSSLVAGFVYGVIGLYLFRSARRNANFAHMVIGLALMIYPFFIENELVLWGSGAVLVASAYLTRNA